VSPILARRRRRRWRLFLVVTTGHEAKHSPSHGAACVDEAGTSMARRAASRYGDWATGDAQSKSESLESSIHCRALEQPENCLVGRKGVARGNSEELLPKETSLVTPPSALGPSTCRADDKEGVCAAFEGAASSTSSSSSSSPSKTSSTMTSE
jgi:hypothetical protein